ncbi:Nitrogen assimilation transcription factor nit-4 like protein [Zymoseptoria brevis]|uniref:Nitrogen assimilation transcription factor nit-4 like protein n=1 Tax=Zymoseptoria brevis TaxID=1047168 RepID=A0A0F4GLY1_9PEZI|nr:Nitrogen assimilation transcription factor nit-4 like protein [Zymoseptoria brevis]
MSSTTPRRGRVSKAACQFCKSRKLRCDNLAPRCSNCCSYDKECAYAERSRGTRPTNAIISSLREENRLLRSQISPEPADGRPFPSPPAAQAQQANVEISHDTGSTSHSATARPITPSNRAPASISKNATYHGPTSTLYDESPATQQWFTEERESRMSTMLFAEAARQRQMEAVNAARGLLDFDGVDPEMGLHLLNLHWNRQHHSFLVTYRPAFMRDMACQGPYFSKILLNAIYFGSAKFSPRLDLRKDPQDVRTAGWRFRQRVRELLGEAMDQSKITTIQALLQMTNSLFALGDEQSAAWLYAGLAFRMIIDIGIHVDATLMPNVRGLQEEDIEIRRRVFWSAFVIDKIQSLYQGRPATLQVSQCDVPTVFKDEYEELETWSPFAYNSGNLSFSGSCSHSVSTFTQLCRLCIILNQILNKLYKEKRAVEGPDALTKDLASLEQELTRWTDHLPVHLSLDLDRHATDSSPPHVLSLLAMANVISILLHRPFVSDGHLHSTSPAVAVDSFKKCAAAATNIVKLVKIYDRTFSVSRAPYLISYATYVAATIHVRIASTRGAPSEAHECLRTCLKVLRQNSETNYAVRKAIFVIEGLMQRMHVDAASPQFTTESPSSQSQTFQTEDRNAIVSRNNDHYAGWEPTFVAGNMAPDLDVDAIIRSFMQEQGGSDVNSMAAQEQALSNNYGEPNYLPMGGMQRFDDMIFGFNAADFDTLL